MPAKQQPSVTDFVVNVSDDERETLARRIGDSCSVESLGRGSNLALIRVNDAEGDARQVWEQVQDSVGGGKQLQPVLLDPSGKPQYPTGEISIRFKSALSESDLHAFAKRHRLRLVRQNEFVPEQAVFEPIEKDQYLPDVVDELSATGEAKVAWANTVSEFTRG